MSWFFKILNSASTITFVTFGDFYLCVLHTFKSSEKAIAVNYFKVVYGIGLFTFIV